MAGGARRVGARDLPQGPGKLGVGRHICPNGFQQFVGAKDAIKTA